MAVFVITVMMMVILLAEMPYTDEAVNCSPAELSPCLGAVISKAPASSTCCQKVREQKPCLCGYFKNPSLRQYFNSPGARKVASTCGVPFPNCLLCNITCYCYRRITLLFQDKSGLQVVWMASYIEINLFMNDMNLNVEQEIMMWWSYCRNELL